MTNDDDLPSLPNGALENLANSYEADDTQMITQVQIHTADNHPEPYVVNEAEHTLYAFTQDGSGVDRHIIEDIRGLAVRLQMHPEIKMLQMESALKDKYAEEWGEQGRVPGTNSIYVDKISAIDEFEIDPEIES